MNARMTFGKVAMDMMKCICMKCPTYNMCMKYKMEGMFCSIGKSSCELNQTGCVCADCSLWTEYELKIAYHCVSGAE